MVSISIDKLRRFAGGNPMYSLRQTGDLVELRAAAPPPSEASSSAEEQGPEGTAEVVIVFRLEGSMAVPVEAYVDSGGTRKPMNLDEVGWWLQVLDQMY